MRMICSTTAALSAVVLAAASLTLGSVDARAQAQGGPPDQSGARIPAQNLPLAMGDCDDKGIPVACYALVRHFKTFAASLERDQNLLRYARTACSIPARLGAEERVDRAAIARSCHEYGLLLNEGTGQPRDKDRAVEILMKACKMGNAESCPKALEVHGQA